MAVTQLVEALDYLEFLDRSWKQVRRSGWEFVELASAENPHGYSALQARDNLRRFNLRWIPPLEQAFFAPRLHAVLRAAKEQGVDFKVPVDELIEDLVDVTLVCMLPPPVLTEQECGDPSAYSYQGALRRFFIAFATGEITTQDLRPHLSL